MGSWGTAVYENDKASYWFQKFWEKFPIQDQIAATLLLEADNHHEEIRAAVFLLIQLWWVSPWYPDELENLGNCAIAKLKELAEMEIYRNSEFEDSVRFEIGQLEDLLENLSK